MALRKRYSLKETLQKLLESDSCETDDSETDEYDADEYLLHCGPFSGIIFRLFSSVLSCESVILYHGRYGM